ncbi:MAG TPA: hypothetical protein VKZ76_04975 [Edaphocola sp.]|nr:hypothetical protein [Edaphocola sp.]
MFYFTGLESVSALNAMMPALYGNQSVARRSIANSQTMAMDIEEPSKLNPDYALDSLYKIILASNPLQ